ncbi:MAG: hypothetical protein KDA83_09070, partial [Planctomycetales bacterium]|nr:hypothetical protein [Planctomycetales bacterium]
MSSHLADSYHRLLGIPPAEQPPSAWRLLGLNAGEKNEQVIRLAMEQRLAFLRTLQQGAVAEISQRLANEVSRAGITLLAGESPGPSAHGPTGTITATPPEARPPLPASMAPTAALAVSAATDSSAGLDSELEWRDDDPSDDFQLEPHDALADEYGLAESTAPVPAWVDEALAALPEPIRLKLEPHAHLLAPIAVGGAIGLVAMLPLTIGVIGVTRWLNRPAEEVAAVAPDPPEPSSETAIPDAEVVTPTTNLPVGDGGNETPSTPASNDATVPSVVTMIADSVPLPPPGPLVANDDSAASTGDSTDTGTEPPVVVQREPVDWIDLIRRRQEVGVSLESLQNRDLHAYEATRLSEQLELDDLPTVDLAAYLLEDLRLAIFARDFVSAHAARVAIDEAPIAWPPEFDGLTFETEALEQSLGVSAEPVELAKTHWLVLQKIGQLWQAQQFETALALAKRWESDGKFAQSRDFRRLALDLRRATEDRLRLATGELPVTPETPDDEDPEAGAPDSTDTNSASLYSPAQLLLARQQIVLNGDTRAAINTLGVSTQAAWSEWFEEPFPSSDGSSIPSGGDDDETTNGPPASSDSAEQEEPDSTNDEEATTDSTSDDESDSLGTQSRDVAEEAAEPGPPQLSRQDQHRLAHATAHAIWQVSENADRKHRDWLRGAAGALHASADFNEVPLTWRREVKSRMEETRDSGFWASDVGQLAPQGGVGFASIVLRGPEREVAVTDEPGVMRLSPNGQILAIGGLQGAIDLFDPLTGEFIRRLEGHRRTVLDLSFFPDGSRLTSCALDGTIRVWDLQRGGEVAQWPLPSGAATRLAVTPQGRSLIVTTSNGVVFSLNPNTGEISQRVPAHRNDVVTLVGTPDGKHWVTAGVDEKVWLWGEKADETLEIEDSSNLVACGDFTSDGIYVALGDDRGDVRFYLTETGEFLAEVKLPAFEKAIAVSLLDRHGIVVVVSDAGTVIAQPWAGGASTTVAQLVPRGNRRRLNAPVRA